MTNDYLLRRRAAVAAAWKSTDACVLVAAGERIPMPGLGDRTYPFRPHTEYLYLSERNRPGSVIAFDARDGWIDFVPGVTDAERLWEGVTEASGVPLHQLQDWLAQRRDRPIAVLGAELPTVPYDNELTRQLRQTLDAVRRPKDEMELSRMRRAADATAAGYASIQPLIRPGVSERQVQIELEAEFFRAGATGTGYDTIVASGSNSAILHFAPSQRVFEDGDLLLIDAGAEVDHYVADVTRTYPVGTRFAPFQRDLYVAVREVQEHAIARCVVDAEFAEIHLEAARELAAALVEVDVLRGSVDTLVELGTVALFFPHGLGHLVGLGVRDASGRMPGRLERNHPAIRNLRIDLPLQAGFVVTVEPGLYFVPMLLTDRATRDQHQATVNWNLVDQCLGLGGVRLEDNVLVTNSAPVVLTAVVPTYDPQ